MSLAAEVKNALGGWPLFAEGTRHLEITVPEGRLNCELTALDRLACSFQRFAWDNALLAGAGLDRLQRVAEQLSHRLSYLLEPIAIVEADALVGVVQMRSSPPQREAEGTTYYELLVSRAGELQLSRFRREPGQPRAAIAAQVTREVFARLANDFASATAAESCRPQPAFERKPDPRALFERGS